MTVSAVPAHHNHPNRKPAPMRHEPNRRVPPTFPLLGALAIAVLASACTDATSEGAADPGAPAAAERAVEEPSPSESGSSATEPRPASSAEPSTAPSASERASTATTTAPASTTTTAPQSGTVTAQTVGEPWGTVEGLTMFRGNPTRTFYGAGPVPATPQVLWRYPEAPMCALSTTGGETKQWCGTGWTGQPVVWERPDGISEVIFGAFDRAVHFVDAATGNETRPSFPVGDLIKGSVTLDPDGYPLLYFGARDGNLRVVALDRAQPTELWSLSASSVEGVWNDDWDASPVLVDDILYEGSENGWFFAIELGRNYDEAGLVTVDPEVRIAVPGYTDDLISAVGRNVSIESSPALFDERVYFANSGGRVVGLDVSAVRIGDAPVVFDYWVGDDVDASIVVDAEGMLYVAVELERFNARSELVGQLVKLDPHATGDPLLWSVAVPPARTGAGGLWATPALHDGYLYAPTHPGELLVVDSTDGEVVWRDEIGFHAWSSPAIVDETLVLSANCESGGAIRAYHLADPTDPRLLWEVAPFGGCIESTPAVWDGRLFVGSRDGYFYALG